MTVAEVFRAVFGAGFCVREEKALDVNTTNDPEPDVVVVPGNSRTYRNAPTAPDVSVALVVVEVADSTLFQDTTTKAELYATAGVQDYWVLDLENDRLLVFRDPQPAAGTVAYRTTLTLTAGDTITLLAVPGTPIAVADLIP
jgi:Uma2 family endonuclease